MTRSPQPHRSSTCGRRDLPVSPDLLARVAALARAHAPLLGPAAQPAGPGPVAPVGAPPAGAGPPGGMPRAGQPRCLAMINPGGAIPSGVPHGCPWRRSRPPPTRRPAFPSPAAGRACRRPHPGEVVVPVPGRRPSMTAPMRSRGSAWTPHDPGVLGGPGWAPPGERESVSARPCQHRPRESVICLAVPTGTSGRG
jgi:hypothetical protein